MDNVLVVGSLNMDFAVYMERESMIAHITRKKMSPTSIGGGGEYHNRRERISPASLKR